MKLAVSKKHLLTELTEAFSKVENIHFVENCEGFDNRIAAKVFPLNVSECLRLLELARDFQCPIYPLSTGKNWGFGASVAPTQDCILLDLSSMNEISNYDSTFGTIRIQPGVTQEQLHSYLEKEKSPYKMDVTGSGTNTSILGNALERGVGYQALRHEHVLSMKVLLVDGTIVDTGYSRFAHSPLEKCLSYGLGPSLNHLFTQSNFGIVLEATFKLTKRCEYDCAFSFAIKNDKELESASLIIKELFDNSIINSIPKVLDKRRCEVTFCSKYYAHAKQAGQTVTREQIKKKFEETWKGKEWTFVTSLAGPRDVIEAKLRFIRERLKGLSAVRVVDRDTVEKSATDTFDAQLQQQFDQLILGYLQGTPSSEALMSMYWDVCDYDRKPDEPEDKEYGFLFITPLVANSTDDLNKFLTAYRTMSKRFSYEPALTLNFLNRNTVEGVISLSFNKKNPFEVRKAHNFKNSLLRELAEKGYYPYRLDTDSMQNFFEKNASEDAWTRLCDKIKTALDPENLLSPGRYSKK